jgi:hypothetical protein
MLVESKADVPMAVKTPWAGALYWRAEGFQMSAAGPQSKAVPQPPMAKLRASCACRKHGKRARRRIPRGRLSVRMAPFIA